MNSFSKKILLDSLVVILLLAAGCNSQKQDTRTDVAGENSTEQAGAQISFTTLEHDFGRVTEGEKVAAVFKFENSGSGALVVNSVTASCGCTVPSFKSEPVKPGDSGTIEVLFDTSNRAGVQTKTIQVSSNAETPVIVLRIVAEIVTNK